MNRLLSIITVTHQSCDELPRLMESLQAAGWTREPGRSEIIVVDSGSTDGTLEMVRRRWPSVRTVDCGGNVGFSRGCNIGQELADAPYRVLLNPDTVIPPGALEKLLSWLMERPRVAAVGPQLVDEDGNPQISTQKFPNVKQVISRQWAGLLSPLGVNDRGDVQPNRPGPTDWISGACLVMSADAWEDVGPLDVEFFLYFEETDWCLRAVGKGWEIHYLPEVHVVHTGGRSARKSENALIQGRIGKHFNSSRRHYFMKHHGLLKCALVEGACWSRNAIVRLKGGR